jgi:hypothetical protein
MYIDANVPVLKGIMAVMVATIKTPAVVAEADHQGLDVPGTQ